MVSVAYETTRTSPAQVSGDAPPSPPAAAHPGFGGLRVGSALALEVKTKRWTAIAYPTLGSVV